MLLNGFKRKAKPRIPVQLTESEFNQFILTYLPPKTRGRPYKITRFKIFNYIMKFLYMGCQWKMLPIDTDEAGHPEIHYSQVFRVFQDWLNYGTLLNLFENSVFQLANGNFLDVSIIHGDGTTTMAKKGGDCLGFSGHKHMKSEKVVAFTDRNCYVLSPLIIAPGNSHEGPLFEKAFESLKDLAKRIGLVLSQNFKCLEWTPDFKHNYAANS